jgi:hypothetical protein
MKRIIKLEFTLVVENETKDDVDYLLKSDLPELVGQGMLAMAMNPSNHITITDANVEVIERGRTYRTAGKTFRRK